MYRIRMHIAAYSVVTLLAMATCTNISCPSQCQCSTYTAKCNGKGLRTIPKGIPLTARKIDLSNNPQLRIQSDYFLRFKHLFALSLKNCKQKGPIYLPNTVRDIRLDENSFTVDALQQMFSSKLPSLKRINLENNHLQTLDTETLLKILPARLTLLSINGNELRKLTEEEGMARFKEIKILQVDHCSLEIIESNAFKYMTNLSHLTLNWNNLHALPENLFKYNRKLSTLQLSGNQLKNLNTTKLGLGRQLRELRAANNRIKAYDLQGIHPHTVMLNDNKIGSLETKIFNNNTGLFVLGLSNNNIQFISGKVFRGVRRVSQLLLNDNRICALPEDTFKGMSVSSIFLQNNQVTTLNGAFNGIDSNKITVILSGNKGFTLLNGSEFQSLSHESTIYLNCQELTRMTNLPELNARVVCIPKSDEVVRTVYYEGFSCNGYNCKEVKVPMGYKCTACRPGTYGSCTNFQDHHGICVKCAAGSYYQDEPAKNTCKTCRAGQFVPPERSPGKHATDCQTCPEGTNTTVVAGTRACKCLHGYSRRYRFGKCIRCRNRGFDCSQDYPVLNNGFWMTWQGTSPDYTSNKTQIFNHSENESICEHEYKAYIRNLKIRDDTYDRRTMHFNCQMPLPIKCPMERSCVGGIEPRCSADYSGVLCAACKRGYRKRFLQCVQCPNYVLAVIEFVGHIVLFCILVFCLSLANKPTAMESLKRERLVDTRSVSDIILSSIKILVGFYQVFISIIYALAHVHWPRALRIAIYIFQYIQFQIINLPSLQCINSDWKVNAIDEFWITLVIIITIPFLAFVYYFVKSLHIYCRWLSPSEAKQRRYESGRNCIKFVSLFLFLTYTLMSTKIMEILPISCHSICTAIQNGECEHLMSFLRSDYSIRCPTMYDKKATLIICYSTLTIPVCLPILLYLLLKWYAPKHRTHIKHLKILEEPTVKDDKFCNHYDIHISSTSDSLFGVSNVPLMTSALKFTYENYQSRFWYWEVIEMIRKFLMTVGVVVFAGNTKIGLTCTIIVAMMFSILHAIYKPFKSKFENGVQSLSLILVPLNLAFAAVLQSQDTQHQGIISLKLDSLYASIFITGMNSIILLILVGRIIVIIAWKVRLIERKLH